jgi:AraC-like DNA-binding protein
MTAPTERDQIAMLHELTETKAEQIAWLVKDHTKAELARIVVAGRIHHAERNLAETAERQRIAAYIEAYARQVEQHRGEWGPEWFSPR